MAERVLTLRELNRATLARQLLLERKRLSPVAVIERLVGMQAQWAPAAYVGIWTRVTSFRRETLERELTRGAVLKATVMRETLHLVTLRNYALLRGMVSESNHGDSWPDAQRVAASVRALAEQGPMTTVEGVAMLEREYGLTGLEARRAFAGGRVRTHVLHNDESAFWQAPPRHRFVAIDPPEAHDLLDARAEIIRRYLAAFGPASRQDIDAWSAMRMPHTARARAAGAAAPFPRRAGPRAPGRAACAASGPGHTRARPLPAEMGQRPAGVGGTDARPAGGVPPAG